MALNILKRIYNSLDSFKLWHEDMDWRVQPTKIRTSASKVSVWGGLTITDLISLLKAVRLSRAGLLGFSLIDLSVALCALWLILPHPVKALELQVDAYQPTVIDYLPKLTIPKPHKPKTTYIVKSGDTLTSVAKTHHTSWKRLWNKNTKLHNPDLITAGQKLLLPLRGEKLKNRPYHVAVAQTPASKPRRGVPRVSQRASIAGNGYAYGWCTFYIKMRRPDIPNNWGDAYLWIGSAIASGYATGSVARAGAIGVQGNHVVYVESVSGGMISLSAMNDVDGWNIVSHRQDNASAYTYIY